jgi:Divergent InlB B-repeat domain
LAEGQFLSVRFFGLFRAAIAELTAERTERKYMNQQPQNTGKILFASGIAFLGVILLIVSTILSLFAREPVGDPPVRPDQPPPDSDSYDLYVTYEFRGSGRVVWYPYINCNDGGDTSWGYLSGCGYRFKRPAGARLTAVPANGWRFAGWQSGDGACTGSNPTVFAKPPPPGTSWTTCVAKFDPIPSALAPWVPEFLATSLVLTGHQEVGLGAPVTPDAAAGSIVHFQRFRDGEISGGRITSYSPFFSSAEMHRDGCIFVAKTPETSPRWYNTYEAVDEIPFKGDWPLRSDGLTLAKIMGPNRSPMNWPSVSRRYAWMMRIAPFAFSDEAEGYGGPYPFQYAPAPRWYQLCVPPGSRPADWTEQTLGQIPKASNPSLDHSGVYCGWKTAGISTEFGFGTAEWVPVNPTESGWRSTAAAGVVANSYLSGGDVTMDHAAPPDNYDLGPGPRPWWVVSNWGCEGVRSFDYGNPFSTSTLTFTAQGQLCSDWEINVRVDPEYRYLLAPSYTPPSPNDNCEHDDRGAIDPACGKGNQPFLVDGVDKSDLGGTLGLEIEQWLIPVPYRPQPGDRIYAVGRWIVDCGHDDWHTELHPVEALQSWRGVPASARTNGNPATETSIIITGAWQGGTLEFDVWPLARPQASAHLKFTTNPNLTGTGELTEGLRIDSEMLVPTDGPNHVHVRVTAPAHSRPSSRFGQVTYDPHLRLAKRYLLWWEAPPAPPSR